MEDLGRLAARKDAERHILGAYLPEGFLRGVEGEAAGVVVVAAVAEEDVLQTIVIESLDGRGALVIGDVAVATVDSLLEVFWIWTRDEHVHIVVGFDDYGCGILCEFHGLVSHSADIGHDEELVAVVIDGIADSLGSVVRNDERTDLNARDDGAPLAWIDHAAA